LKKEKLFGIEIAIGEFDELIDSSLQKENSYACFLNAHMVHEHRYNSQFSGVLSNADFVFPDGMPIVYSIRSVLGIKQNRIAGNDAIFYLINKAKKDSLTLFFIGGTEELLKKIKAKTDKLNISAGFMSPPYAPIEEYAFEEQAKTINKVNPDIILVGLGCPKQEIWMNRMKNLVRAPMYGVGGAFLLYAGVDSRAPKILRDLSLEWLYRLLLEPRRLFKRYLVTNSSFLFTLSKEVTSRIFKKQQARKY
jgi:N-acetylglucosaminyldiphosphoundecaprenol N-acetyl-beta-D-mannosaminyltransferase